MLLNKMSSKFKLELHNILVSNMFFDERRETWRHISNLINKNNIHHNNFEAVGFYHINKIFDFGINIDSWLIRIPLDSNLYDEFNKIMDNYSFTKKAKNIIITLLNNAFIEAITLGDLLCILPKSFHAEIRKSIIDFKSINPTSMSEDAIQTFIINNDSALKQFKEYLLLRMLIK